MVSEPLLLGIDVGTSSAKATAVDRFGREIAHGLSPVKWTSTASGAEIGPQLLLESAVRAAQQALRGAPEGRVVGVGVASMAETGVLLDRRGRPVAPAIAWHDSRGALEAERLAAEVGAERFARHTGLPISPLPTITKYRWMRDHWPAARTAVRWLNVAEWIVRELGGEEVSELSLACRTGFYDVGARRWWDDAREFADVPTGLLPEPQLAGSFAGDVRATGLPGAEGAALAVGGHDHLCAARGAGAVGDGETLDSCGTAEAFVRASAPLPADRIQAAVAHGICVGWHVVDGIQALLGSLRSGAALQRILALLGVPPDHRDELEHAGLLVPSEADGVKLLNPGDERMTLTGIGRDPSPALVYRAALEAVGEAGAQLLANMAEISGPLRRLVVTGGWAEGEAARAVKERHLGRFEYGASVYTGARGAAFAAASAAGLEIDERAPLVGVAGQEHP
jgi:sugar (pentulose or hexulose) kinase